jgi:hypothetical protein
MSLKAEDIKGLLKETLGEYSLRDVSPVNVLLLLAICLFAAMVFFPSQNFFGFKYKVGDVVVMDLRSPVDIETRDVSLKKGEIVVREGERVTEGSLLKFALVEKALEESRSLLPFLGFFVLTLILIVSSYLFASMNIRKFTTLRRDLVFMSLIFISILLLLRFSGSVAEAMQSVFPVISSTVFIYMVPVALGAMLVRLFLNSETALIFALVVAVMAGYFFGRSLEITTYFFIGGVVAAMGVRHATQRATIMKAGIHLGLVNCLVLLSMAAIKGGASFGEPFLLVFAGLFSGIITAIITVGTAPLLEMTFGYTTNIKLLELSRMDHPLLKELAVSAPGTYHHSVVIGTLVEAGAEAINANPLLARVSAYYHDVGKIKMPLYFIENVSGENKHDKLAPSMSALILTKHVKEGIELAESHGIGKEIVDVIAQHHGTSLISFFYNKAKDLEEADVHEVNEKDFRYPGPKPQTREAGLVMLADALEAASRTLQDPSLSKIQGMTQTIVNRIFADGQLDECELTLKDLHAITSSFNRVLAGIYHQRIDYPEPENESSKKEDVVEGNNSGKAIEYANGNGKEKGKNGGREGIKRLGVS